MLFRSALGRIAICALLVATATKAEVRADIGTDGSAPAPSPGAMLRGTVVDSAGGALAGVALTLINAARGTQRETLTTRDGTFAFAMLAPGRYALRADHLNFAPAEIRDLDLVDGVSTTITVALQVARVRETVAVRGQLSSLASGTAGVGTVIDREAIDRLPANGRSVQSLIALTPGVINTSGVTDASGDFSVNGQRPSANYFMVDGVGANIANAVNAPSRSSQASGGALPGVTTLGTTASLTPYEALEEVRVQTSSYAAEYGRQPGAQVSLVTRAGDSTWHGSLSTQIRHEAFNANDWFANRAGWSRLPMRQEQVGGMIGGPLTLFDTREDRRTFVLIAHEHVSLRASQLLETWVPALSLRQQALPDARLLLDAFPRPDASSPTDGVATIFAGDDDARYRVDTTSVRVDHRVNPTLSLFGRLNVAPSSSEAWKSTNLATRHRESLSTSMLTVGATHQWRRMATDLRINLSANRGEVDEWQTDHFGAIPVPRSRLIPAGLDAGNSAVVALPFLNKAGPAPALTESSSSTEQHQINIVGTTTVAFDRHRVKFGIDLRQLRARLPPRDYDLLVNVADATLLTSAGYGSLGILNTQPTDIQPRFTNLSAFAQDTWSVLSRVTFDVGVRWELNPPPGEAHNRLPYTGLLPFDGPSVNVAPAGTPLWRTRGRDLAPRAGAAWVLREAPGSETTLRAGGGCFTTSATPRPRAATRAITIAACSLSA